jgi:hypothetical protein
MPTERIVARALTHGNPGVRHREGVDSETDIILDVQALSHTVKIAMCDDTVAPAPNTLDALQLIMRIS